MPLKGMNQSINNNKRVGNIAELQKNIIYSNADKYVHATIFKVKPRLPHRGLQHADWISNRESL